MLKDEFVQELSIPIFDEFINTHFDELDILATHYYIEEVYIEDFSVLDEDDEHFFLKLEGSVYSTHQFGSDSDVRKGDGVIFNGLYSIEILISVDRTNPLDLEYFEIQRIHIDTKDY